MSLRCVDRRLGVPLRFASVQTKCLALISPEHRSEEPFPRHLSVTSLDRRPDRRALHTHLLRDLPELLERQACEWPLVQGESLATLSIHSIFRYRRVYPRALGALCSPFLI